MSKSGPSATESRLLRANLLGRAPGSIGSGRLSARQSPRYGKRGLETSVALGGLSLVLAVASIVALDVKVRNDQQEAERVLANAQKESEMLSRYLKVSEELVRQDSMLTSRIRGIQALDVGRFTWPHILAAVGNAVPTGLWLTRIEEVRGGRDPVIALKGGAIEAERVGQFLGRLQNSPFLTSPRFISADQEPSGAKNGFVTSFSLEVQYREPRDSSLLSFIELQPLPGDATSNAPDPLALPPLLPPSTGSKGENR